MYKNPFTETLIVPYIRYIKRDVSAMKMVEGLQPADYFDVEIEKHTRLYRNPKRFADLMALSASALRLALWIMYNLGSKATSIRLVDTELSMLFDCSCRQVLRMRTDLLKAGIIAKKKENEYWINPRFFAADSRLNLYPENCILEHTIKQNA